MRFLCFAVEALKLKEGDHMEIRIAKERVFEVSRDQGRQRAVARLRKLERPAGFVFDREEANAANAVLVRRTKIRTLASQSVRHPASYPH